MALATESRKEKLKKSENPLRVSRVDPLCDWSYSDGEMNDLPDPAITGQDLSRLVEEHYPKVLRRLRVLVGNRHAAEDLAQEVFARFVTATRGGRRIENTAAYLNGVIHHVFCQHLREKRTQPRLTIVEDLASDGHADLGSERSPFEAILELVQALPEQHQAVIVGRFFLRMSVGDMAKSLQRSERTISLWQAKAMKKLRYLAIEQGIDLEQTT